MIHAYISDTLDDRALLSIVYMRLYGSVAPEVHIMPSGKPYFPNAPDIYFSLSHTASAVMVAIGDMPCGCDIERSRAYSPNVPAKVCAESELLLFDFLDCWVLKESYLKISGDRSLNFKTLVFSRSHNGSIITPSPDINATLYPFEGHHAAVCCFGKPPASAEIIRA